MYQLLTIAIIIAALLLILIVLVQNSKGGGLASNFGGGANRFGGVAEQKSKLENYTWGLVIAIVVMSIISSVFVFRTGSSESDSHVKERLVNQNNVPYVPSAPQQTPAQ